MYVGLDALWTIIPVIRVLSEKLSDNPRKDTGNAMHVHPLDSEYTETVHRRVTHKDVCISCCFGFNNPTLRYDDAETSVQTETLSSSEP